MSRSHNGRIASSWSGEPTGTATTIQAAPPAFTVWSEAIIVAPVAIPSSTKITVRPATGACGRTARYISWRRAISASCRCRSAST